MRIDAQRPAHALVEARRQHHAVECAVAGHRGVDVCALRGRKAVQGQMHAVQQVRLRIEPGDHRVVRGLTEARGDFHAHALVAGAGVVGIRHTRHRGGARGEERRPEMEQLKRIGGHRRGLERFGIGRAHAVVVHLDRARRTHHLLHAPRAAVADRVHAGRRRIAGLRRHPVAGIGDHRLDALDEGLPAPVARIVQIARARAQVAAMRGHAARQDRRAVQSVGRCIRRGRAWKAGGAAGQPHRGYQQQQDPVHGVHRGRSLEWPAPLTTQARRWITAQSDRRRSRTARSAGWPRRHAGTRHAA